MSSNSRSKAYGARVARRGHDTPRAGNPYGYAVSVYDYGTRRRGVVRPSPLFLIVLAITVAGGLMAWLSKDIGSRWGDFAVFVFVLGGWVVSVCFHEFAHAYAAYRAGDRSVEAAGYLTLNPFKYAHPVLSILLPLVFIVSGGIGLPGGAVYLHPHTFRSKASRSIAAGAGPAVNLVLGVACIWLAAANDTDLRHVLTGVTSDFGHARFWSAIAFLGFLQMTAAVLNLLPVPGLDGWAVIEPYLNPITVQAAEKIKPWGMIGVIVLLTIQGVNVRFFQLVYWIYDRFDSSGVSKAMASFGREFFRWWAKNPR
jgi:Zn-dependent protease